MQTRSRFSVCLAKTTNPGTELRKINVHALPKPCEAYKHVAQQPVLSYIPLHTLTLFNVVLRVEFGSCCKSREQPSANEQLTIETKPENEQEGSHD